MKHVQSVSRTPSLAQLPGLGGNNPGIDPIESLVLILLSIFFSSYRNFPDVIGNLQKYYQKN